ncbi:uncharacterized protein TrAtP1_010725 [Trichoderma atroviride]|uniref:uncharacterized protein n=1 Tax=Hypocrea atroviridis TaxID=63577 RepID=UPI003323DD4F|nr:hypothetical protein TrAtP1_010725 [Trichoderma atroviride]
MQPRQGRVCRAACDDDVERKRNELRPQSRSAAVSGGCWRWTKPKQKNERGRRDGEGEAERVKEEPWLKGGVVWSSQGSRPYLGFAVRAPKGQSPDTPTSGCASECLTGRSEEPSTRRGRASGKRWMTSAGALCLVRRPAQLGLSERVSAARTLLR